MWYKGPHIVVSWALDLMQVKKNRKEFIEKISGLASNKNTKFLTDNLACERVLLSIGSAEEAIYRFPWFSPDQIDTTQGKYRSRLTRWI